MGTAGPWGGFRLVMEVPSGKRLHSYGKPPFLIGKSTNSMAIFHSYVKVPEGTPIAGWFREWITLWKWIRIGGTSILRESSISWWWFLRGFSQLVDKPSFCPRFVDSPVANQLVGMTLQVVQWNGLVNIFRVYTTILCIYEMYLCSGIALNCCVLYGQGIGAKQSGLRYRALCTN